MPGGGMPGGGIPGGHPGGGSPACCMLVSWLCCTKFAQDALPTGGGGKKFGGGGRNGIPGNTDIGAPVASASSSAGTWSSGAWEASQPQA